MLAGRFQRLRKRFDRHLGDLPHGYDHKYIYTQVGYNFNPTDMQATIGVAQSKKLPILSEPTPGSAMKWGGFKFQVQKVQRDAA